MGIRPHQMVWDGRSSWVMIDAKPQVRDVEDRQCQAVSDFFRAAGRLLGIPDRVEQVLYFSQSSSLQ